MDEFDVLAVGGTVIDGTGREPRRADVGVRGDRIAFVGPAPPGAAARRRLDCAGLAVAPGFIDLHSHADFTVAAAPGAEGALRQGVTTLVTGNCGTSPFPTGSDAAGFEGFARSVQEAGPAVNVAALVGHAMLRAAVLGQDLRPATGPELDAMRGLLADAAREGVFGLSTGLIYAPGSFAGTEEIVALAETAREHGLLYATHMRDEGDDLLKAVDEALETARRSGVRLQISHLKAMGPANHGKVVRALALIDAARAEGVDVATDVYPYAASSTQLSSRLPDWALDGGLDALLERLARPETRERIAAELRAKTGGTFLPEGTVLAAMPDGPYTPYVGASLREIADERGADPADVALDVLAGHRALVFIVNHAMAEDDVDTVLRHPAAAVASDGWELDTACGGHPHPRHFGAFARALGHHARDRGLLTLPQAVHKMTGLPASRLGLTGRGTLAEGHAADLAVFEPGEITDRATYAEPLAYAEGVRHVVVNGRLALADGAVTGERPGRVLRRGAR
ncbi:D-aminoacylase [Actinocorallia libanotica]|uniref:D-aminoacylase n=1 Tax=Actinocorallia libanotica TaxID=46162 RepID=A0ABN1QHU5_9ACTN